MRSALTRGDFVAVGPTVDAKPATVLLAHSRTTSLIGSVHTPDRHRRAHAGRRARRATPASAPLEADALSDAQAALARGAWQEACERFERASREAPSARAWEGLAVATSYLDEGDDALEARERAFRLYREQDDARGAARCAVWLAHDTIEFRGDLAVANGWLQRARSILADVTEPTPEGAFLRAFRAHVVLQTERDTAAARQLCAEAIAISRRCGAIDIEMIARAIGGLALVSEGRIAEGMSGLDEATAAAVSGEMRDPTMIASSCCFLIDACERVRDHARAMQWCERVRALAEQWRMGSFFVVCRTQYAGILMCRGELAAAEAELETALRHAETHRPPLGRGALVRLGELRRRQGRLDEAEALFARMGGHRLAVVGRALIALQRGEAQEAADLLDGLLHRMPPSDRTERALGLEVLARAYVTLERAADAERTVSELEAIASAVGTDALEAAALAARGVVLAASARHAEARHAFDDAIVRYEAAGERYELARTRVALARSLGALGRRGAAVAEAGAAAAALDEMGAVLEARAARECAHQLAGGRQRGVGASHQLSPRELEVLRLVAGGSGDKAIAARLALSEHTVHRHISNILRKLGVSSRAAAAAHAVRHQLV